MGICLLQEEKQVRHFAFSTCFFCFVADWTKEVAQIYLCPSQNRR